MSHIPDIGEGFKLSRGRIKRNYAAVVAISLSVLLATMQASIAQADGANSFAGTTGLVQRFVAEDFDSSTNTWNPRSTDVSWVGWYSSPTTFSSSSGAFLSQNLSKKDNFNLLGVDGSVSQFTSVAGSADTGYLYFPGEHQGIQQTVIYVARYSSVDSQKRQRILTGYNNPATPDGFLGEGNAAIGFWNDSIGFAYYGNWYTDEINPPCFQGDMYMCQASASTNTYAATVQLPTDWVIVAMSQNVLRVANPNGGAEIGNPGYVRINGLQTGAQNSVIWEMVGYGINVGYHGQSEKSDFEIADFMVFDHSLSDAEFGQVEKQLAKTYGISLAGTDPDAPAISQVSTSQSHLAVEWLAPAVLGDGDVYKYQVRYQNLTEGSGARVRDVDVLTHNFDAIQTDSLNPDHGDNFRLQVRAISTSGVSEWSAPQELQYVGYPTYEHEPNENNNNEQSQANTPVQAPVVKSLQVLPSLPSVLKRGKKLNLALATGQSSLLTYSASGKCKVLKTYGKVSRVVNGKRKKVKVLKKVQLKATKSGLCTLNRRAPATGNYEAVSDSSRISIK